jgi:hypothetical protein
MIAQTAEVREQHRFDVTALERYLGDRVAGFCGQGPGSTYCAASRPANSCPRRTRWIESTG